MQAKQEGKVVDLRKYRLSRGSDTDFFGAIYNSLELGRLRRGRNHINIIDAMCGHGELGLGIEKRHKESARGNAPQLVVAFNDVIARPLRRLKDAGYFIINEDVRCLEFSQKEGFDVAAIRHGLEEQSYTQVRDTLKALFKSLKPKGRIVIAENLSHILSRNSVMMSSEEANQLLARKRINEQDEPNAHQIEDIIYMLKSVGFVNTEVTFEGRGQLRVSNSMLYISGISMPNVPVSFVKEVIRKTVVKADKP